ncbi:MAG: RidA family protein [Candidatus Rokubacteria bacterium]|nr:RidA family protein [Candidatus Rokubacteria bacterium]
MEKRYLTKQIPSKWPFSHGVAIKNPGTLVILAGQVAFDRHGPNRQLVGPGDLAAQTRQAILNIRTLLGQCGATLKDVVDLTAYLTDIGRFEEAGRVAMEYFTDPLPTLTLIGVKALAFPELLIEIRAVAVLADRPAAGRAKPARRKATRRRRS